MVKEKTSTESGEIPLNEGLLDESSKLKEERRILKERIAKIESERGGVSKGVFEKVHQDYSERLQSVTDKLLEKKQDIDRELAILYETRDKIQANLKGHKEALEEIQFRHKLGEFPQGDFLAKAKDEEDKVARFEKVASGVLSNIKRYEQLFEGEEELFGVEAHPLGAEELDEWEKEASAAEGGIAKGETPLSQENAEWMEATKPNVQVRPQLTIISGNENVGKSFPIDGTVTIGRSHTNKIILKDAKTSRQHAEIKPRGDEVILIDLNSSNGTLVNGERVQEHVLSPNDEIQIGDYTLQYQQ